MTEELNGQGPTAHTRLKVKERSWMVRHDIVSAMMLRKLLETSSYRFTRKIVSLNAVASQLKKFTGCCGWLRRRGWRR
jgi:hypothetical protein